LVESDQPKTAFCALGNLYQYTRLPFGLKNAVAYCTRLMKKVFEGFENVVVYVDDLLVFGKDKKEHDENLERVLRRIGEVNLSLNKRKCNFGQRKISFLGYTIEDGKIRPDENRLEPILNFVQPINAKGLQRFLGMAVYYSKYIENFSELSKTLYEKLKLFDDWIPEEIEAFNKIKQNVAKAVLTLPPENDNLVLRTDASNDTISAVLETSKGEPVYFCSRILGMHEKRYDTTEKEALAIYWGITRLKSFLLGKLFTVYSDHKALLYIFENEKASPKILRWNMALQEFNFKVKFCPGKENIVADALTRVNLLMPLPGEELISENEIAEAQKYDPECQALVIALTKNYKQKPVEVSDIAWEIRNQLEVHDGLIKSKLGKIFVPYRKRIRVLKVAHSGHIGENHTCENIRNRFLLPNLKSSVHRLISNCRICTMVKPKYQQPPCSPVITQAPLEVLALDFVGPLPASNGFKYLLVAIDHYSRYPFVFPLRDMTTERVIVALKQIFSLVGFPDAILTDRGTSFESHNFKNFLNSFHIKKLRTNTYHPQGNSICERFNGTLKRLLKNYCFERGFEFTSWTRALDQSLLTYRSTRHTVTGYRPADLFFQFKLKGYIPNHYNKDIKQNYNQDLLNKTKTKHRLDQKTYTKDFKVGDKALLQKNELGKWKAKNEEVEIIEKDSPYTVRVKDKTGAVQNVATSRLANLGRIRFDLDDEKTLENIIFKPTKKHQPILDNNFQPTPILKTCKANISELEENDSDYEDASEFIEDPETADSERERPIPRRSTRIRRPPDRFTP